MAIPAGGVATTAVRSGPDALADDIVLIDHGAAVATGSPRALKARIGDQRVDVVAVDHAGLDHLVAALDPVFDLAVARDRRTISIPAPNDTLDLSDVTAAVRATGVPVDELALRRPTLDDAFLALTGQSATAGTSPSSPTRAPDNAADLTPSELAS